MDLREFILGVIFILFVILGVIIVLLLTVSVGMLYAFVISFWGLLKAISNNKNPYIAYNDLTPNKPLGAKRNYFFGPGKDQVIAIVSDTFILLKTYLSKITKWRTKYAKNDNWWVIALIWTTYIAVWLSIIVFGFLWSAFFSIILFTVLYVSMGGFYLFFASLLAADWFLLKLKSISNRCSECKRRINIPAFQCKKCGYVHTNLTPGPYGVFKRKCQCGEKLPTTFFSGRSKLPSSCPYCATEITVSDACQYGIQLVGSTTAGKSTFMAAFWHTYLDAAKKVPDLKIKTVPSNEFAKLENWYTQGLSDSTEDMNAKMYSIIHDIPKRTKLQFSIYDNAGEVFSQLNQHIQQQQFQYCEGMIFVVDLTDSCDHSQEALEGFLAVYDAMKGVSVTKLSNLPVAVIISKADLFKKDIGLSKINAEFRKKLKELTEKDNNNFSEVKIYHQVRNDVCRTFLSKKNFGSIVKELDSKFINIAFFPVSAIGHELQQGQPYEPWGVHQPVFWIFNEANINKQASEYFKRISKELNLEILS